MLNRVKLNAPINNEIVTIDEYIKISELEIESNPSITFNYELNNKASKSKDIKSIQKSTI